MRFVRSPHRVVILAAYALGAAALLVGFPQAVAPTWSHEPVPWSAPIAALMLPTAMLVTDWLLRGLCVRHPVDARDLAGDLAINDAIMVLLHCRWSRGNAHGWTGCILEACPRAVKRKRFADIIVSITGSLTCRDVSLSPLVPNRADSASGTRPRDRRPCHRSTTNSVAHRMDREGHEGGR